MKFLKINIDSIRIKGDPDDLETLQIDVYERITAMIEAETLGFTIDEDEEDAEDTENYN